MSHYGTQEIGDGHHFVYPTFLRDMGIETIIISQEISLTTLTLR